MRRLGSRIAELRADLDRLASQSGLVGARRHPEIVSQTL